MEALLHVHDATGFSIFPNHRLGVLMEHSVFFVNGRCYLAGMVKKCNLDKISKCVSEVSPYCKLWCVLDVAFTLKIDTQIIVWQNGAHSYLHFQQFFSLH
jgi:hypothetical protein